MCARPMCACVQIGSPWLEVVEGAEAEERTSVGVEEGHLWRGQGELVDLLTRTMQVEVGEAVD